MTPAYIVLIFGFLCVESAPVSTAAQPNKFSCVGQKDGFYPDPNSCESFIICAKQTDVAVKCTKGLQFNPTSKFCDFPKSANCKSNSQTLVTSTNQPGTATKLLTFSPVATNVPQTSSAKSPIVLVFGNSATTIKPRTQPQTKSPFFTQQPSVTNAPVPTKAQTKLLVFNKPATTQVPVNTNSQTQLLIFNRPVVTNTPTQYPFITPSQTNTPSRTTTALFKGGFCYGKKSGLYRDPNDCGYFFQCSYGFTYRSACDKGLVYNDKLEACDYPYSVPACFSYKG